MINENGKTKEASRSFGELSGELAVRQIVSKDETFLCLYGDPSALRCLAEKLEQLARLEQDSLTLSQLPVGEGFHVHFRLKKRIDSDPTSLLLGRLDAKGDGNLDWFFQDDDPARS